MGNLLTKLSILGRVEIKETKEAALHSLHLTITDMQKWDEGDYSCEGTKLDGSAVRKIYHVHVNGRYRVLEYDRNNQSLQNLVLRLS